MPGGSHIEELIMSIVPFYLPKEIAEKLSASAIRELERAVRDANINLQTFHDSGQYSIDQYYKDMRDSMGHNVKPKLSLSCEKTYEEVFVPELLLINRKLQEENTRLLELEKSLKNIKNFIGEFK